MESDNDKTNKDLYAKTSRNTSMRLVYQKENIYGEFG